MIKFNPVSGLYEFTLYLVTFNAHGVPDRKFTDDRQYWVDFVAKWYHHDSLNVITLNPTAEQTTRLDEVNAQGDVSQREAYLGENAFYVETGGVEDSFNSPWLQDKKGTQANTDALLTYYKERLEPILSKVRFDKEVGGVEVNGSNILTTRESQSTITAARMSFELGMATSLNWKTANGWVTLDAAAVNAIATAVHNHVEKAYTAEKTVFEAIQNITDLNALKTFDVASEFDTAFNA